MVVNDSRVFPARLIGRTSRGATVELLLIPGEDGAFEALGRPARRLPVGERITCGELEVRVVASLPFGRRSVELAHEGDLFEALARVGRTPLPPYIKRSSDELEPGDRERYQTVYADRPGSIAAPTAGLHFSNRLLAAIERSGVERAVVTLHVGYGTFQPIRVEEVEEHRIEPEFYSIPEASAAVIERTRARGGRVVAVGTTTVRALESAALEVGRVRPGAGRTSLYIHPGFHFRIVDALLTNFHLPRSSLFLLVAAFAGVELVKRAYEEAVRHRYRFYSYGDCMLLSE
jgi:S-adenosylmethionine:tRNA ribosyltransferase-isomerase